MSKIGIFGGTFNPVHKGHERTAVEFYGKYGLDKLMVIPSNIPPHKQVDARVTAIQRFEMCRVCFGKYSCNICVSDIEIRKHGVSYTYDTLADIRKSYTDGKIYFLVGSDMFLCLESWYKYQELLKLCAFVVAFRNERDKREVLEFREKFMEAGAEVELLENEPFEISSTELRRYIINNRPGLDRYISAEVLDYIKGQGIYGKLGRA